VSVGFRVWQCGEIKLTEADILRHAKASITEIEKTHS
jgi:hypothetical protein